MDSLKVSVFLLAIFLASARAQKCVPRSFGFDSFVCVCNSTYCDYLDPVPNPAPGAFTRIVTSRDGYRFEVIEGGMVEPEATGNITVTINHNLNYQSILGFGGAFTDATGINIVSLSDATHEHLMRSYFNEEGLEYSLCRVPIAGSDFSTHPYSYDDVYMDVDLEYFSLAVEDYNYKLPLMKDALARNPDLLIFGSPWAPPYWMKSNNMTNGVGILLPEMWDPYTKYLVKWVRAYESQNLTIWGMTPQNEPMTGFQEGYPFNTCGWTPEQMRDWIKTSMGPIFEAENLRRIKIMCTDHNRPQYPWYPQTILEDEEAAQYVDGSAVHWYDDEAIVPEVLTDIVTNFPDKFLLQTEACVTWYEPDKVHLGAWMGGEKYATDIIENLNYFAVGWVDWNMALDIQGGPNWVDNFVDSPIIVNSGADEFYKQPMYYMIGHFSKFIERGATRLYSNVLNQDRSVRVAAFHNTDDSDVIVLYNLNDVPTSVSIQDHVGEYINIVMEPNSIETILAVS